MAEIPGDFNTLLKKLKKGGLRQISCEICAKEVTNQVHMQCFVWENFYICVPWFKKKATKKDHTIDHDYMVKDTFNFPIYSGKWTAIQEQQLLEGLKKHGFGNWSPVAELVGKTSAACEAHFRQIFIEGKKPSAPLSIRREDGSIQIPELMDIEDEVIDPAIPLRKEDDVEPSPKVTTLKELAGYMEKRRDFEMEYENDIEMFLSDLDFFEDDTPEDREIKFKQLRVYNAVLDEREERKNFAIDRWHLEIANEKRYAKNYVEKNIYTAMKPLARFMLPEQFTKVVDNLIREQQLRKKLKLLKEARSQGKTTEAEFKEFLRQKKEQGDTQPRKDKDQKETPEDENPVTTEDIENTEAKRFESVAHEKIFDVQDAADRTEKVLADELGIPITEFEILKAELLEQIQLQNEFEANEGSKHSKEVQKQVYDYVVDLNKKSTS